MAKRERSAQVGGRWGWALVVAAAVLVAVVGVTSLLRPDTTSDERVDPSATVEATAIADAPVGRQSVGSERVAPPAPVRLGTYAVAKPGAGFRDMTARTRRDHLVIPVYREPGAEQQALLDVNRIEGITSQYDLVNTSGPDGVLVLRVLDVSPDGEWLQVQAPARPHDRFVWVRAGDFDLAHTTRRIEIDLAGEGALRVFDGDAVLFESPIVQGRAERPSPVHVTYLRSGIAGELVAPAYGLAILDIASYSEALGSFGSSGGLPSNYVHGTNQPALMGKRVSSGEIRVPNENLAVIIELAGPGTPVILHDGQASRSEVLGRKPTVASTTRFEGPTDIPLSIASVFPKLWHRCVTDDGPLICSNETP